MLRIIRFLWGYVVFDAKGNFVERFINLATKAGICLFDVKKQQDILCCSVLASEYLSLKKIAKKSSIKIKIKEKHGFPFFLKRRKKRKGVFWGLICFIMTLYVLSLYIWSIDIKCDTILDKNEFDNMINNLGISTGILKNDLDIPLLEKTIMNNFENISWVSANINGSTLNFEIKERVEPPQIVPKTVPCNIKANNDGQILRMEVYNGAPEIQYGDAVVKGQLLISGFVEDDFGGCNICHADGKVFALTKHEIKKELDFCQLEKQKTGKTIVRKKLKLFGLELPLTLIPAPKKDYEKTIKINNIKICGVNLPISCSEEIWSQFSEKEVTLSAQEALIRANQDLDKEEQTLLKDVKIISKDKKEKVINGKVIVIADYVCEENIAVQEEIIFES